MRAVFTSHFLVGPNIRQSSFLTVSPHPDFHRDQNHQNTHHTFTLKLNGHSQNNTPNKVPSQEENVIPEGSFLGRDRWALWLLLNGCDSPTSRWYNGEEVRGGWGWGRTQRGLGGEAGRKRWSWISDCLKVKHERKF